ncbi:hypothetical protein soil367_11125 [Hydrocarboniclastica marina]|uniref:Uncharacterized protein n=1 Tax=Hydrocarboniclastica marina TaxID=2259620 RepID=A0A4P7XJB2_9ALTE|nr:hypothetical protein soil367_11125 [Hydrocarboniclastica marina]
MKLKAPAALDVAGLHCKSGLTAPRPRLSAALLAQKSGSGPAAGGGELVASDTGWRRQEWLIQADYSRIMAGMSGYRWR